MQSSLSYFIEGNYFAAILGILLFFVFPNIFKILNFITEYKKKRLELIEEALNSEHLLDKFKPHLENQLNCEYVKLIFKKDIEPQTFHAILNSYDAHQGRIPLFRFIEASKFLEIDAKQDIHINISTLDKVFFAYTVLSALLVFLLGVLFAFYPLFIQNSSWLINLIALIAAMTMIIFSGMLLSQERPMLSAKKLRINLANTAQANIVIHEGHEM